MQREAALAQLTAARFIPVVRASSAAKALDAARALARGGCRVIELTTTVPDVLTVVKALAEDGIVSGVGTVMTPEVAASALDAGAAFLVSPHFAPELLMLAKSRDRLYIPGALTPTEVATAHQAGASVIKIFPVESVGGARYLKLLRDPMPYLSFLPTGGITLDSAADFLAQGAICVGVGSDLAPSAAVETGDTEELMRRAQAWAAKLIPSPAGEPRA